MTFEEIISYLEENKSETNIEGMKRFGIYAENAYGMSAPILKSLAKKIGKNHPLALKLWDYGYHDTRILAGLVDDALIVTRKQMEKWAKQFDNWAICDSTCGYLFDKVAGASDIAIEWTERKEEFVKRAGFVIITWKSVHDKKCSDEIFFDFFRIIKREANDERRYVMKAVNWALRQIGKRNALLQAAAIQEAEEIYKMGTKSAKWIASDALRELQDKNTRIRNIGL